MILKVGWGGHYCTNISHDFVFGLCLPQWDEVSVLDDRGKLIRTFEVCNVNQNPRVQDNWLATPFLYRHSAPRVFVTLRFSVRDCASLRSPSPTCRETLTLFYKQADSQRELERTWMAEVRRNPRFYDEFINVTVHKPIFIFYFLLFLLDAKLLTSCLGLMKWFLLLCMDDDPAAILNWAFFPPFFPFY